MWQYAAAWFPMVVIAIVNGIVRQSVYGPHMTELLAHQVSSVTGIALFAAYMWFLFRLWPPVSGLQALLVGLMWLAMTIAFEFLFGHYVAGHDWGHLLQDYNLLAGRLWVLVLAWTALGPYLIHRVQH
jgi:hypothetical protein